MAGHKIQLTKQEQDEFLQFLDTYEGCPPLPLKPTENKEHLRLEDNLLTFYIRHRHNDWSGVWMRENLKDHRGFRDLPNVLLLLIQLCDSHHLECHKLEDRAFDPRLSGGQFPQIIHMRFLACVLRLSDILENDRERNPEVLFNHRDIEERKQSLVHWIMPHCMNTILGIHRIEFHANPPSAVVHRALLQLADWIDDELHGIACLREKLPEAYKLGTTTINRPWCLPHAVQRHIRPEGRDYKHHQRPPTGQRQYPPHGSAPARAGLPGKANPLDQEDSQWAQVHLEHSFPLHGPRILDLRVR